VVRAKRATQTLTIEALLREGQSAPKIAEAMGISKQRVHQIKQRMLAEAEGLPIRKSKGGRNAI